MLPILSVLSSLGSLAVALGAPCRVQLVPRDAPQPWVAAVATLERTLRAAPPGDRDCREIVIRASADQASVEVTTADGRRGVRLVADAVDVESTVAALIVTVPPNAPVVATPEADVAATARPSPDAIARGLRFLLVAGGGARLMLPSTPAPLMEMMLGTVHRSWELALFGNWAPTVIGAHAALQAPYSSTSEFGLGIGRRQPFRRSQFLLGARVGAIRFSPNAAFMQTGNSDSTDNTDALVGPHFAPTVSGFFGAVIPALSFVGLRLQASIQWIPQTRLGTADAAGSLWSVGLSLAVESTFP